jgi:hypothetical protein
MEVRGKLHASAALSREEEPLPRTHWIGGWVDPQAGLNAVVKIHYFFLPSHSPLITFLPRSTILRRNPGGQI